jgi:carbon monoxide dehydrogenase subunit G
VIELRNTFTIPAPLEEAWQVLLDVERIAPCMPGASLESVSGDEFEGAVKVKLGAMMLTYRGKAKIVEQDAAAHRAVIEGSAKEARGAGTAKATVVATLHPDAEGTKAEVVTSLNITGRPAQFGRGVMAEVAERLIDQFADRLRQEMIAPEQQPAAAPEPVTAESAARVPSAAASSAVPPSSAPEPRAPARAGAKDDDAIDLLAVAGGPMAKRAAVTAAVIGAVLLAVRLVIRSSAARGPALARGATVLCSCGHEGRLS